MKRNLLFHLYPKTGSVWPWHVARLLERKDVWNGRRIVTVATDESTAPPTAVKAVLSQLGAELFFERNSPDLGETAFFTNRLALLRSLDPEEATFYAHSKGATHEGPKLEAVMRWTKAMYDLCLDSVPAVERALSLFAAVGCFRHMLNHAGSRWCYGGTFFWFKHSILFSRDWMNIERTKYGTEGYPGRHLRWGEMAAFTPDDVGPEWLYGAHGGVTDKLVEEWKKKYWSLHMHASVIEFLKARIFEDEIRGKDVLEVGSFDVNGTPRAVIQPFGPRRYIGVDSQAGPCVDHVVGADGLAAAFGRESFDVVVCTEMLEHAFDWRGAVSQMKEVLRPGGLLVVTTRSEGFPYHGYPSDHWRFSAKDFSRIFRDMHICDLTQDHDPKSPGVFMKAYKPKAFAPVDLSQIQVAAAPAPPVPEPPARAVPSIVAAVVGPHMTPIAADAPPSVPPVPPAGPRVVATSVVPAPTGGPPKRKRQRRSDSALGPTSSPA